MVKKIVKYIIIFIASILLLTGIAAILVKIYSEPICKYAIKEISSTLNAPIKYSKTEASFFRHFPYISIQLENFELGSNTSSNSGSNYLIKSKSVYIQLNVIQIIKNEIAIKSIEIKDGNIKVKEIHQNDFIRLLIKDYDKNSSDYLFTSIDKLFLTNVSIDYSKVYLKHSYVLNIENSKMKIYHENGIIKISSKSAIKDISLNVDHFKNLKESNFNLITEIDYTDTNLVINSIELSKSTTRLNIAGYYKTNDSYIKCKFENIPIKNSLLFNYNLSNESLKITNCFVDGEMDINNSEIFFGKLNLSDGELRINDTLTIQNLSANIDFDKNNASTKIEIAKTDFYVNKSEFHLSGKFKDEENLASFTFKGKALVNAVDLPKIQSGLHFEEGKISLDIMNFSGDYDKSTKKFSLHKYQMDCSGEKIMGTYNKQEISDGRFQTFVSDSCISIHKLFCKINSESDITLKSQILNEQEIIKVTGEIESDKVNINDVLKLITSSDSSQNIKPIDLTLKASINELLYKSLYCTDVTFNLKSKKEEFLINHLDMSINKGKLLDCSFKIIDDNYHVKGKIKKLDISEVFEGLNDFGQNTLTSNNIEGELDASFNLNFSYKDTTLLTQTIEGETDLDIFNGRLVGFKPIESLSKFINEEKLKDIQFERLKCRVKCHDNKIYIPSTSANNTALNFTFSGIHSFDNEYEYHFQVFLSDLLKKKNAKPANYEVDSSGMVKVFLKMKGKGSNYDINYDTKEALHNFGNKIKKEKDLLKSIFKEEFGLFKGDSAKQVKKKKKSFDIETEDQQKTEEPKKPVKEKKKTQIEWKDE